MAREISVFTPENIAIEYELAGIGTQFAISWLHLRHHTLYDHAVDIITGSMLAAISILGFIVFWGYYLFFELRWSGQTPGKRQLGLRVIKTGGYPVDAYSVIIRNLLRVLDFLPFLYFVGIISILFSKEYQRLGDIVAGTVVIKQRAPHTLDGLLQGARVTPEHLDKAALALVARDADKLSPEEYRAVRHFTERRRSLSWDAQQTAAMKIAVPLMERLRIAVPEEAVHINYADFLEYLAVGYELARRPA
jgi:hypothetical protein